MVADQCRAMSLQIGDTIEGREKCGKHWNETRLTLLWLGATEAVFLETWRGSDQPEWTEPQESANWTLDCRKWKKIDPAT